MQQTVQNRHVPFWAQPGFDPWAGCPESFYATKMVRAAEAKAPVFIPPQRVVQAQPGLSSARSTGMRPQGG